MKKVVGFIIVSVILLVSLSLKNTKNEDIYFENNASNNKNVLSMMLEQTEGVGDYKIVSQSSWQIEGYKFNSELSRCENGGSLSWDDNKSAVIFQGRVTDKCYVYFDKVSEVLLVDYIKSQYTGTQGENSIYYHDASLTNGAGDNSYRYAGGNYALTDVGKATGATMLVACDQTTTTALIDFYCNGIKQYVGVACAVSNHYYTVKGDTTTYQTYDEALTAAVTKGYLTSDNVKNFVCFGSTENPCPTDNLYRIIGVFGKNYHGVSGQQLVKLIKYDYAKSSLLGTDGDFASESSNGYSNYYWNKTTGTNTWSASNLNKINLNTNFLSNIGSDWTNKISTVTWKVGGNTYNNITNVKPSVSYKNEIVNPAETTTYDAKVGLMYISDYLFSASPTFWTYTVSISTTSTDDYKAAKGDTWLYGKQSEHVITRATNYTDAGFCIEYNGFVYNYSYPMPVIGNGRFVRPTFNLNPDIYYVSGVGSIDDPIRIN